MNWSRVRTSHHILIVDDDPLILDLLSHVLAARGYRISLAGNGTDALLHLELEQPDVIVLDAMMPIMDGYEVLQRLKGNALLRHIPVLMLTARPQEHGDASACSDDYILKPFKLPELLSRLEKLLGH